MSRTSPFVLDSHGSLLFLPCPWTKDEEHMTHARRAYDAALPTLLRFCEELVNRDGWVSIGEKGHVTGEWAAMVASRTGKAKIMLPWNADGLLLDRYAAFNQEMFGALHVKYHTESSARKCAPYTSAVRPSIANAPRRVLDIIYLLQCALPGQFAFVATQQETNGIQALSHVNMAPPHRWCMEHFEHVFDVVFARIDPPGEEDEQIVVVANAIKSLACYHHFVPMKGRAITVAEVPLRHPIIQTLPFRFKAIPIPVADEPTCLKRRLEDEEDASCKRPRLPLLLTPESLGTPELCSSESPGAPSEVSHIDLIPVDDDVPASDVLIVTDTDSGRPCAVPCDAFPINTDH